MRTVTFKSVLDRVASYLNEADGLDVEDWALSVRKLNLFARLGWRYYWFPEWMALEKRTFRPFWDAGTNYAAATEVLDPLSLQYFQSLRPSQGQAPTSANGTVNQAYWAASAGNYGADRYNPAAVYKQGDQVCYASEYYQLFAVQAQGVAPTDATQWGLLTAFVRSIAYAQPGESVIGDVRAVWTHNPRTQPMCARRVGAGGPDFRLDADQLVVLGRPNIVWVEFRKPVPDWSGPQRDDVTAYATGTTVYDLDKGDYYTALADVTAGQSPTTNPELWDLVAFPWVLAEYTAQSAYAMLTDREQEEPENFGIQNSAGLPLLIAEVDNLERQQGQTRQLNVVSGRR